MRTIISNLRTARMTMMFILALLTTLTVQAAADKTALTTAVSEAETYHSSIQESNPSVASVLQMIIDAAKQVQGDDSYTQSDLEFATTFMQEVLKQAKEAVTTGVASARAATSLATKYYDLQGRRVAQPSRAGVYINNGVKVVSK